MAEFIPTGSKVDHALFSKTDITDYRVVGRQTGGENTTWVVSKCQVITADAHEVACLVGICGTIGPKVVIIDNKNIWNIYKNSECGFGAKVGAAASISL